MKKIFTLIMTTVLGATLFYATTVASTNNASSVEEPSLSVFEHNSLGSTQNDITANQDNYEIGTDVTDTAPGRLPRTNYTIIDSSPLTNTYWDQPNNYGWYRISVTNTRSETLNVTISYGGGTNTFSVSANGTKTIVYQGAWSDRHFLNFITPSGIVSGSVTVRVSDVAF